MPDKKISKGETRRRRLQRESSLQKQSELDALDELREYEGGEPEVEDKVLESVEEVEEVEKFLGDGVPLASHGSPVGAVTFDQLDQARTAEKKAWMIQDESYDVRTLVRNIVNNPMLEPSEKGTFIKKVGQEFGDRVAKIMDTTADMLKESPLEALEIEAMLAKDARQMGFIEKHAGKLYPKKEFVRKSLLEAVEKIKGGGNEAESALESLPELMKTAKEMGISKGMEDKEEGGILVQKDAQGDWRWVGWPSNNFKDRSDDILTEKAHQEFVSYWNENRDERKLPIFTSMHTPGTVRKGAVDFVGYENGFLVMSGKLTEDEAAGLLRVQKDYDLGMSHTGWAIRGNPEDARQITKYRLFEVTDLPVSMADNPFAEVAVISQEVVMSKEQEEAQLAYLTKLTGDKELAKLALSEKTSLKQAELQEAGVEQKEAKDDEPKADDTPLDIDAISKELGLPELSEVIAGLQKSAEIVPILEKVIEKQAEAIQKLDETQDEKLEKQLTPPAEARFSWMEKRESASEENIVEEDEKEKLKKSIPNLKGEENWLSDVTNTEPIAEQ